MHTQHAAHALMLIASVALLQTSCRGLAVVNHSLSSPDPSQGEEAPEMRVEIQDGELTNAQGAVALDALDYGDVWREAVWIGEGGRESRPPQLAAVHFIDRAVPFRPEGKPDVVCFNVELNEDALYQMPLVELEPLCKTSTGAPVVASVIEEHVEYVTLWYRATRMDVSLGGGSEEGGGSAVGVSVSGEIEPTYSSMRAALRVGTLCCELPQARETLSLTFSNDVYGLGKEPWRLRFVWSIAPNKDAPVFDTSDIEQGDE